MKDAEFVIHTELSESMKGIFQLHHHSKVPSTNIMQGLNPKKELNYTITYQCN